MDVFSHHVDGCTEHGALLAAGTGCKGPVFAFYCSAQLLEDLCVAAISGIKCMYLVSSLGFRLGDYSTGHSCEHLLCNPLLILYVVGQICISQLTPPPKACGDFGEGREVPHSSGHGFFFTPSFSDISR